MKKSLTETRKYRLDMNEKILNSGFRDFNKFFTLDNKAYVDGALPAKMKELMGLVGSMVLRCNVTRATASRYIHVREDTGRNWRHGKPGNGRGA